MNMREFWLGFLIGFLLVLAGAYAASAETENRETFEIACNSFEDAVEHITGLDKSLCYNFEEAHGFQPWGLLEPIVDWGDKTIYFVDWGNTASGVYAIK